jgi:hypothetical protein
MADSDNEAEQSAALRLASSPHYLAIAVWQDERLVCELSAPGAQDPAIDLAGAP